MVDLDRLARERTDLSSEQIAHLHLLTADWTLLSDLSFSDLVMWLPTWNDAGFVAAAQVLPAGGSVEPPPAPRWESPEADGVALEDPAARVAPRVRRHLRPTAAEARLRPGDLEYAGAFRLPEVEGEPPRTWDLRPSTLSKA